MTLNHSSVAIVCSNIAGALGYLAELISWVALALACLVLLPTQLSVLTPDEQSPVGSVENVPPKQPTSMLATIAGYVITAVVCVLSLYLLAKLPYRIANVGSTVSRWLLARLKIKPTNRQLLLMKSLVAILPITCFMVLFLIARPESLVFTAFYVTALIMTVGALAGFTIQATLAKRFHIPVAKIW